MDAIAISSVYASVAVGVLALILLWLTRNCPEKDWGDVRQAVIYSQTRRFLLALDEQEHGKLWRPSVLLLADMVSPQSNLIQFVNDLKKVGCRSFVSPIAVR